MSHAPHSRVPYSSTELWLKVASTTRNETNSSQHSPPTSSGTRNRPGGSMEAAAASHHVSSPMLVRAACCPASSRQLFPNVRCTPCHSFRLRRALRSTRQSAPLRRLRRARGAAKPSLQSQRGQPRTDPSRRGFHRPTQRGGRPDGEASGRTDSARAPERRGQCASAPSARPRLQASCAGAPHVPATLAARDTWARPVCPVAARPAAQRPQRDRRARGPLGGAEPVGRSPNLGNWTALGTPAPAGVALAGHRPPGPRASSHVLPPRTRLPNKAPPTTAGPHGASRRATAQEAGPGPRILSARSGCGPSWG